MARDPALHPFDRLSIWNMPIGSGAQLSAASDARILTLQAQGQNINANNGYSHPVYQAASGDPAAEWRDTSQSGRTRTGVRTPTTATPSTGTDHHLHVIDPDKQYVTEAWLAARQSNTLITAARVERNDLRGPGFGQGGVRAYGGSAIGGLVRTHEVAARHIPHAIALGLNPNQMKKGWVWPATTEDGGGNNNYSGTIPMGTLFAIPGSVNLATLGLNPDALALATAFQDYGGYVTDQAAPFIVYVEQGANNTAVNAMVAQLQTIKNLLRVVTNNTPSTVGGGGTPRVALAEAFDEGPPPAGAPSAPTNVTASPIVSGIATLSWQPPTTDNGAAVTSYRVSRNGTDTMGTGAWSTVVAASVQSYDFYNLDSNTVYTLSVEATNASGTGPASTATTGASAPPARITFTDAASPATRSGLVNGRPHRARVRAEGPGGASVYTGWVPFTPTT